MTPQRLTVPLAERSYDILIDDRLLAQTGSLIKPLIQAKRAIIVTDTNVGRFHLHRLTGSLEQAGIASRSIVLDAGEQTKRFAVLEQLLDQILETAPDRHVPLIALGGGVIGDITGFAASITLRGVPYIQIPTTLLAQVDSSVGGKTAVNSQHGKNLIGTFWQPKLVIADTATLSTLPKRELLSGYAEIVKYGLINDYPFFDWLETNGHDVLALRQEPLTHAILTACRAKADIVSADERESGARALLNLGHTFAHALEAETGFSDALLHGEAVAIGMCMAFAFSAHLELCSPEHAARVAAHLKESGLPISPHDIRPDWNVKALMKHFAHDKKAEGGTLTFILARGIGQSFVAKDVDAKKLESWLKEVL